MKFQKIIENVWYPVEIINSEGDETIGLSYRERPGAMNLERFDSDDDCANIASKETFAELRYIEDEEF